MSGRSIWYSKVLCCFTKYVFLFCLQQKLKKRRRSHCACLLSFRFLNPALYKAAADKPEAFQAVVPKTYDLSGTPLEQVLGEIYKVFEYKLLAIIQLSI